MNRPVLACLGDSLTQGWGLVPAQALPARLQTRLAEAGEDWTVRNFGVSGETAADGLLRVDAVLRAEPDAAMIEFGANDAFTDRPPERLEADLDAICLRLGERGRPLLLVGLDAGAPDIPGCHPTYIRAFNPVFGRVAARHGALLFPDITASFRGDPKRLLADGFHPNAAGALALTEALLPLVLELCRRARARRTD